MMVGEGARILFRFRNVPMMAQPCGGALDSRADDAMGEG